MTVDISVRRAAAAHPSGPPVVLLHGFASSGAADWPDAPWIDALARSGREAVVVDLPGHGGSAALAAPLGTAQALDAIAAAVGGETVDVIAYSLGARLAWDLPARIGVRRMVLGGLSPVEPFGAVDLAAARSAAAGGEAPADPLTGLIAAMAGMPGNDAVSLLNLVEGLAAEPFHPEASAPGIPVLLVGGVEDPMVQGIDRLAGILSRGEVVRVPGDHLAALRSPEFAEAAIAFLTR